MFYHISDFVKNWELNPPAAPPVKQETISGHCYGCGDTTVTERGNCEKCGEEVEYINEREKTEEEKDLSLFHKQIFWLDLRKSRNCYDCGEKTMIAGKCLKCDAVYV